jgi:hypothetical protein
MPNPIDTPEYWIEDYKPSGKELDALYEHVLEAGRPFDLESLARELVRRHVARAMAARRARESTEGTVYQPSNGYEVGQRLVFPALEAEGEVVGLRPGNNPAYGSYDVLEVKLDGERREFAARLDGYHALSQTHAEVDPDEVAARFAPMVAPRVASQLASDGEWLRFADRWILRALLPEVNTGHRNLAEAVIMLAGEPLPAEQILAELDLDSSLPAETRAMALGIALAGDERFRNVGAMESPLWTLRSPA